MLLNADELPIHAGRVAKAAASGRLVPFLGAGINMCERQPKDFVPLTNLPNGWELAQYLAQKFNYPPETTLDLARVSQFIFSTQESGPFYEALGALFRQTYTPTIMHRLLGGLPRQLEAKSKSARLRLIVTTNYDDLMEISLAEAGAQYDVVWYEAEGPDRGRFRHKPWNGQPRLIESPKDYDGFDMDRRTVILKIHGAVDRWTPPARRPRDSFVITEDHYIEYLLRAGSSNFLPSLLAEELAECHILFIGYGLRDWNMRALLRRVWQESRLQWPSWAVQRFVDPVEEKLWEERGVTLIDEDLKVYCTVLQDQIRSALA